jgi:uncharacterized protein YwqG
LPNKAGALQEGNIFMSGHDKQELTDQIAAVTRELGAIDPFGGHVGRENRLVNKKHRLFEKIDAAPDRRVLLQALLDHSEPEVRMSAAWHCGWAQFMLAEAERAVVALQGLPGKIGEDAQSWLDSKAQMARGIPKGIPKPKPAIAFEPMPSGVAAEEARAWIAAAFPPERARQIEALLRPAARAWPTPPRENLSASCFGGLPPSPAGLPWPEVEGEPLLFVAQINCAELWAAVGPTPLPEEGLLQFFADSHELCGCGPYYGWAVRFVAPHEALTRAPAPDEDLEILPHCGVDFFATVELPHAFSVVVEALGFTKEERDIYWDLRTRIVACGVESRLETDEKASKLLGWPDLVQRDLGDDLGLQERAGQSLLLQIGWYHDGSEWQCWGPGGAVYFVLGAEDLAARRFERTGLEVQTT